MIEETIKCKNCGATIDLSKAKDGVVECEYCGSIFTIPKKETSTEALSFLHQGEHDLDTCRFDDAYTAYSKAAEYDSNEPEAYFGMSLAEFKVQYIKDKIIKKDEITKKIKTTDHLQPICYSFIEKEFSKNKNYLHALELATDKQKTEYEKKAKEIDDIRKKFIELKESGLDFDTFICVKVSKLDDEQTDSSRKNWTQDAYNADSIYDLLKREGYSPFFSEREVKGRTGVDYEALILYALYTSETMLVVCSNEEYLNTPWVKNEYTRFKELVNNKDKENDSLTIVFDGTPIERLPGSIGKIQGIDYSRRAADFEIVNFVKNHTPLARAKREEERRKKEEEAEQFRKQIEEQKKVQQDLEKKINNLNTSNVNGGTSTIGTLLTRANQEMEVRNFTKAEKFFETVLERAPENGEAWWGKFLCDFKVLSEDEILNIIDDQTLKNVVYNQNYKYAKKYADINLTDRINAFVEKVKEEVGLENLISRLSKFNALEKQKSAIELANVLGTLAYSRKIDEAERESEIYWQQYDLLFAKTKSFSMKLIRSINLKNLLIFSFIIWNSVLISLGFTFKIWQKYGWNALAIGNKINLSSDANLIETIMTYWIKLGFLGLLLQITIFGAITGFLLYIIRRIAFHSHDIKVSKISEQLKNTWQETLNCCDLIEKYKNELTYHKKKYNECIKAFNDELLSLRKDIKFKKEYIDQL